MAFNDLFNKKMSLKGQTTTKTIQNNTERAINRDFLFDIAYRKAIRLKTDITTEEIDLKEVNVERTTTEKKLLFRPNTNVLTGEYFSFHQRNDDTLPIKTYIAMEIEDNALSPIAKVMYCNQLLRWINCKDGIPATFADSSYGSKGVIHNNEQLVDFDSRGVITVQKNKLTEEIFEGMRFILGSRWDIFTVTKKKGCKVDNIWELTVQYVKSLQEDDFETGVAFNKELDKVISVIDVVIQGLDNLKINSPSEYKLNVDTTNVIWSIDSDSLNYGIAQIVSQTNNSCIIKSLIADECFILTATDTNGIIVATLNITTSKR